VLSVETPVAEAQMARKLFGSVLREFLCDQHNESAVLLEPVDDLVWLSVKFCHGQEGHEAIMNR